MECEITHEHKMFLINIFAGFLDGIDVSEEDIFSLEVPDRWYVMEAMMAEEIEKQFED